MDPDPRSKDQATEVQEPENSTVEDWMGQSIERDTQTAEKAVRENETLDEAEEQFDREADGEERHARAYPRPGQEPPGGASGEP